MSTSAAKSEPVPQAARIRHVPATRWRAACEEQAKAGHRFCALYAANGPDGVELCGVFAHPSGDEVILAPVRNGAVDTVIDLFPAALLDEREAHDSHGVRFEGHSPLRPLISHPGELETWTVKLEGDGTHQVAVGPIHAGVIESGHFRFAVVGERILHLDLRLFYKHRGLEIAAEGHTLSEGLRYAQRACAACAVSNSVAYAQACESALGLMPDEQMRRGRTLLLELERLYNHLGDISAICAGVGFSPGAMALAALKERAQRLNLAVAGHRFIFHSVAVGASALRVEREAGERARAELAALQRAQREICHELRFAGSLQARLGGVGALSAKDAALLGAVGPVARASGSRHDVRRESPRLSYAGFVPPVVTSPTGDVAARMWIREAELEQTFAILDELLERELRPGEATETGVRGIEATETGVRGIEATEIGVRGIEATETGVRGVAATDIGIARIESPRGETTCAVHTDGESVQRLHLRTGSYANWPVLVHACRENLLPDFPLINKSFELCYACVDR